MIDRFQLLTVAAVYQRGGVFCYPTESVYGIGCNPFDQQAVIRIFKIKKRDRTKPLIIVADSLDRLKNLINPAITREDRLLLKSWPGPYTFVFPVSNNTPLWLRSKDNTIALRVSSLPIIQTICQYCNGPLISTSANYSGQSAIQDYSQVKQQFQIVVDYILQAKCGGEKNPSTILKFNSGKTIRYA